MDERTTLQLQVLEKIGAPLAGAAAGADAPAAAVATLLGFAGENGAALAQSIGGGDAAVRVALTAIASRLLAGSARRNALPDAQTSRQLAEGLNAALVGGQALVADAARLETLDAGLPRDPMQLALQQAAALAPVIIEISAQPFGGDAGRATADIAARLTARAAAAQGLLAPALTGPEAKVATLEILRGFATVYAAAHAAAARQPSGTLDGVWTAFERHAALLETLAGNAVPGGGAQAGTVPRATPPPIAAMAPVAPTPFPATSSPPAATATPAAGAPAGGAPANPMAFFKPTAKKAASGDAEDSSES